MEGVLKGLQSKYPSVFILHSPCPPEHGLSDEGASRAARLALESRAFPVLVHDPAEGDTLADYQASKSWTAALGDKAKFHTIVGSSSHVIEENVAEQKLMLDGLKWLDA